MSYVYTSRKSPLVAGILSVIPGLGQIYNEQTGKGLFMFVLFIGTFLFFVLHITPFTFLPQLGAPGFTGIDNHTAHFVNTVWMDKWGMSKMTRIYPLLWFMVLLPFFVVFSIADAVQNARRINLSFDGAASSPSPTPPPPPRDDETNTTVEQDRLRNEAQQKMEGTTMNAEYQTPPEEAMNSHANSTPPPEPPPAKKSRGVSGKFLLGVILMTIGGIYILDTLRIDVFYWFNWESLWPLIPLFFGLRLLREYQRDRDRGQFVLGTGFTLVGLVFFLENWGIFPAWNFLEDFWMFLLFGIGILFVLTDLFERRREK